MRPRLGLILLAGCATTATPSAPPVVPPPPPRDTLERVGGELRWCHDGACAFTPDATNGELQLASLAPDRDALLLLWRLADDQVAALVEPSSGQQCELELVRAEVAPVRWAVAPNHSAWVVLVDSGKQVVFDTSCAYVGTIDLGLVVDVDHADIRADPILPSRHGAPRAFADPGTLHTVGLPAGALRGNGDLGDAITYCTLDGQACRPLELGVAAGARWFAERSPHDRLWRVDADLDAGAAHHLALVADDGTIIYQGERGWRWDVTWAAGDTTFASEYSVGCNCGASWVLAPTGEQATFGYAQLAPDGRRFVELPTGPQPGGPFIGDLVLRGVPDLHVVARATQLGITDGCAVATWHSTGATVRCATTGGDVMIQLP